MPENEDYCEVCDGKGWIWLEKPVSWTEQQLRGWPRKGIWCWLCSDKLDVTGVPHGLWVRRRERRLGLRPKRRKGRRSGPRVELLADGKPRYATPHLDLSHWRPKRRKGRK